jgi:hypothetical protein
MIRLLLFHEFARGARASYSLQTLSYVDLYQVGQGCAQIQCACSLTVGQKKKKLLSTKRLS